MKQRKKLFWRLFSAFLLITLGVLFAAGWYSLNSIERFIQERATTELADRARLFGNQLMPLLDAPDTAVIDELCERAGMLAQTRFTIIQASGTVLGDTREIPRHMDNHASRPEVAAALDGGLGSALRFSNTLQQTILYVAVTLRPDRAPPVVVRAAIPAESLHAETAQIRRQFWMIGTLISILALAAALISSRLIGRQLNDFKQGAARLAEGELAFRLPAPEFEETAGLAESMNRMASQLEARMQTVVSQRNQLEAVLSSMVEGVIAFDREERIISVNPAAASWFEIDPEKVRGRSIQETIRNLAVQQFVSRALGSGTPIQDDIVVYQNGARILNIRSAALLGFESEPIGTLVVFDDVTQLRRLENMRRDFVANVSHEIKTPLTAIKGFVETLHQGGVKDAEESERFLGIIAKHVNRLSTIVEDLLMLSRIEQEGDQGELKREPTRLWDVFQNAIQICRPKADEKEIDIALSGDDTLTVSVDPMLLEQAVVNLLDNAIKYSEPLKTVHLEAGFSGKEVQVRVRDHGIGIEKKHLSRLFERFYRVDKARSRTLGGTGLGLAIVKHIAQAHGGQVTVNSTLWTGSTFTIHLPGETSTG
jgi:two-component system phosphate regulon sensor histidine kinase PhoR